MGWVEECNNNWLKRGGIILYKLHIKDKSIELREDNNLVFISSNRDKTILNEIALITEIILKHKDDKYIKIYD